MRVSIFGLGYVGAVCAGCLSVRGHKVIGVDVSQQKIDLINAGRSPIVEPGLEEMLKKGLDADLLEGTTNIDYAIANTDLSMICVGTPSKANGDLELTYIEDVCSQMGVALGKKPERHTIVVRSTVLPGTVMNTVIPLLEQYSGKKAGVDFGIAMNPEFLRESTAIRDYVEPPMTVIGELDAASGQPLVELYADVDAPIIRKSIEVAEMIKYTCNVWHATKVTFANEIGIIAKALGVDGREVMDVVCQDRKLNLSRYYMRPGFAFGGSCLPKDVRALTYRAAQLDVSSPLIGSLIDSNDQQVMRAFTMVSNYRKRKIGLLGLAFKAGTDDLRESPLLELAEMLIGKGYDLKIFDRNVEYARNHGANSLFITERIPHVSSKLTTNINEVVDHADVIIIGNGDELFETVVKSVPENKHVLDLVGFMKHATHGELEGICW